ncbi:MAG: hypothetical protein IIB61_06310 [Planctomycetes bacterium]|nr:hypothetical protein [Planctomycetota bacterium]
MSSWILTLLIFSPLAGALLLLLPRRGEDLLLAKAALVSGFVTFALSLVALVLFFGAGGGAGSSAYVLNAHVPWVSDNGANIGYRVGVDGISIWLLLLTTFLTPLAIWSSFTSIRTRVREYYILLLLLEVGMLGVFCAKDLLLFYVSFEFTLIPLYFLIGIWGGYQRRRVVGKFLLLNMAGGLLMTIALLSIWLIDADIAGQLRPSTADAVATLSIPRLTGSFSTTVIGGGDNRSSPNRQL